MRFSFFMNQIKNLMSCHIIIVYVLLCKNYYVTLSYLFIILNLEVSNLISKLFLHIFSKLKSNITYVKNNYLEYLQNNMQ